MAGLERSQVRLFVGERLDDALGLWAARLRCRLGMLCRAVGLEHEAHRQFVLAMLTQTRSAASSRP